MEGQEYYLDTGHPMRRVFIGKVIAHISVGESGERLLNAARVLEELTGQKPVFRKAKRTIREFGIRRGENIACMVTLRGEKAYSFLKKALAAVNYEVRESSIDDKGNFAFGIREHILIPGTKYDPSIGIYGMDVIVALERPGYRVARRRRRRSRIGKNHYVTREEAKEFIEKVLGAKVV